jgi:peptidoglycan hydrolase CwlO-like protein
MAADETGGGVWKTIALVLTTILITGTPGIVYALRTWSLNDDVRDRLTRLEAQKEDADSEIEQLHQRIDALINQSRGGNQ